MILIANKIAPRGSNIDILQTVFMWFLVLINRFRIVPFDFASIVTRLHLCVLTLIVERI